ncbi:MAG TPA: alkaline phosphatase family protein [Verrucomicrobiae bacterium]|jgi:phospholipase C|nr:alkaline phosphatase family protein [Verrucomicrobiae bacterium]
MQNDVFGSRKITRRRLIGSAARLAALAAASSILPPSIRRALAEDAPRPGSLRDIKHVVMLMQENRSFDHYFGTMAGVRGFDDPNALILPNGKSVFHQPDPQNPNGYLLPFHLDTLKTSAQKLPSTSHAFAVQHASWNGGKMDNWLPAHRKADGDIAPYVMGYHTRADIPFQFALAEAFTICDGYFCSVMGPTWPNRMYWMTGTIDPEGKDGGPLIRNKAIKGGFRWMTYAERLEKAGVSWKIYNQSNSEDDQKKPFNVLQYFTAFQQAQPDSPLYRKGLSHDASDQFDQDARNDKLPTVSWIMPTGIESEHPDHMPAAGADFVARKIEAIASNPEVWAKTVFILNYDENDGIFDHVAPPVPPEGTAGEFIKGLPIGGGFRVPCVIVSPWTAGGWVCSQPFDHTSVLQFVEKITGVTETNITDWRRKTFGDLTAAFRFSDDKSGPAKLPETVKQRESAVQAAASLPPPPFPDSTQTLPTQEKGPRKRVPKAQV